MSDKPSEQPETEPRGLGCTAVVMPWISIAERLPPLREDVLFCCEIDGEFTRVDLGQYGGEKTHGDAVVMDLSQHNWSPCSHWMQLPDPPSANNDQGQPRCGERIYHERKQ